MCAPSARCSASRRCSRARCARRGAACASAPGSRRPWTVSCSGRSATTGRWTIFSHFRTKWPAPSSTRSAPRSFADLSEPLSSRYTENVAAYRLYLRGRFAWNKRTPEGVAEGIRYFEEAIAVDPSYAPAWAGLSDSWALHVDYRSVPVHEGFARAREYARRALSLDDTLAEAHASLAWVLFVHDWDWDGAAGEFRRAIELDPSLASAHQWFSFLHSARANHEEALVEVHTALEIDSGSVSIRRSTGWCYYYARRYEQAYHHLERAVAMNPLAEESHRILGLALFHLGRVDEAEQVLRDALSLPAAGPYAVATLGYLLAARGRTGEARALLARLEEAASTGYVSPVAFATLHVGLGNLDLALDFAERARDERRGWLAYLGVNPLLDPLRGHPRFEALRESMGLARGAAATGAG